MPAHRARKIATVVVAPILLVAMDSNAHATEYEPPAPRDLSAMT